MVTVLRRRGQKSPQDEFLAKFGRGILGMAMRILSDLGVTREIRCYPNGQLLLFRDELEALKQNGIEPEEINQILYL